MNAHVEDSEGTRHLLERIRAGEAQAFDHLLASHRAYLVRVVDLWLEPRVRARVDPSDVVQEAQMEASRRLESYLAEPAVPFRLWLRQITYERLLMLHRRHLHAERRAAGREAVVERSSVLLAEQLLAPGPTPSQEAVRRELAERVHQALEQLPAGERQVLVLRNLEGLSNLETAQVLGVDPATASRRYGRAVIRLREILDGEAFQELRPWRT